MVIKFHQIAAVGFIFNKKVIIKHMKIQVNSSKYNIMDSPRIFFLISPMF